MVDEALSEGARAPRAAALSPVLTSAQRRVFLLSVVLAGASWAALASNVLGQARIAVPVSLPWWVLALGFAAAELLGFDIEINREAHCFTFSEVPLTLGLCLASPFALVVGRLAGGAAVLLGRERQRPLKLFFNLSMYLGECCLALVVFDALRGSAPLTSPRVWFATAAAVFAADALSITCVALAIHWHGSEPKPAQLLLAGGITASANTSLGLATALLLFTSRASVGLLAVVAAVLVLAYRAYSSLARRYESLELFYDFTKALGGSLRAESVLEAMLDKTRELLRADTARIALFSDDVGRQVVQMEARTGQPLTAASQTALLDAAWLTERVVDRREVVVIPRSSRNDDETSYLASIGVRDAMIAPLLGKGGVIGVITVGDRIGEISTFDGESARLFQTLANHASVALENGRLIDQLNREVAEREFQALHDALTGLPNRSLFFARVAEAIGRPAAPPFSVLLMDLDGFKDINDTLGHHSGDLVLQEVARRLSAATPANATVARLGGDEFAALLPGASSEEDAIAYARRFNDVLREPLNVEDVTIEAGSSIGIARWPEHSRDASGLVKSADVAMYVAKSAPGRIAIYEAGQDMHSPRRLALGAQLRGAIDRRDLLVYYQPKARLSDGAVIGAEALVRWRHPEHGMMSPDEFIAVAERTGSIGALTTFVLRMALEQCHEWRRRDHELTVAVNLSVQSLLDTELPSQVERLLALTGADPSWLTLEITESNIMDPRRGVAALERLAATGVQLSIDDFGTGYSSLSYLARLPVHELKIDKSFVMAMGTDESNAKVVRTIVDLGENLDLHVVAEGIEDQISWDALRAAGCHAGQGYYLSKPVPAATLDRWLANREAGLASARQLRLA